MNDTRVLGIAGWSGSGKTTLITKLIPLLGSRGVRVATLKHAHHAFDVDTPGKDSYEHRKAGACEVIVSSARRWVQMHEVGDGAEATLAQLLARLSPCNLVLVEGFKTEQHPKIEVFRRAVGKTPLHPEDKRIVAIASPRRRHSYRGHKRHRGRCGSYPRARRATGKGHRHFRRVTGAGV
jgi:molybdopterin-guanine dinucleotide biosynthesis adapter protein